MRRVALAAAIAYLVIFYHRPAGMLAIYHRDRPDFPRQRAAINATIAQEGL